MKKVSIPRSLETRCHTLVFNAICGLGLDGMDGYHKSLPIGLLRVPSALIKFVLYKEVTCNHHLQLDETKSNWGIWGKI